MIIARDNELQLLRETLDSEYSQFVAVYGRRRIGKTFLIREAFNYDFTFEHSGIAGTSKIQEIDQFCISLKRAGLKAKFDKPDTWMEAFELLKDLIIQSKAEKKVIFIDELSWMDTKRSDLIIALESFWNGWASARKDIVLIVCASATTWMIDEVIHNKGGLYNRLNLQINLKPFTLKECEKYLISKNISMNRQDILECYMILGGVPYYWSLLRKELSMPQNIDRMFFAEGAILKDEFEYLFKSLFKNPTPYIAVVTALGKKKAGMTREELSSSDKLLNSGNLTKCLNDLENSGFIKTYNHFGNKKKNAVYQLIDNYTLFYFKFIETKTNDEEYWTHMINMPSKNAWCGLAFERICFEHIPQIKKALGISGVLTDINSWRCVADSENGINGSQIDMLISRRDRVINLCEMKYSEQDYSITKDYYEKLRKKILDFRNVTKNKDAIHLTIITTHGLNRNMYSSNVQSVVTADDLFE